MIMPEILSMMFSVFVFNKIFVNEKVVKFS